MYKILCAVAATLFTVYQCCAQKHVRVIWADDSIHIHGSIPVKYTGKVLECYQYHDKTGTHILLTTSTVLGKNLFARCYIRINNRWVQEWQIKDAANFDWVITDEETKIADIDHDGIFETIVVYSLIFKTGNPVYSVKAKMRFKNENYDASIYQGEYRDDEPILNMGVSFYQAPEPIKTYVENLLKTRLKLLIQK
jgi:hypothetical protein